MPRTLIEGECQLAIPRQWSSYIIASTVKKILNANEPQMLDELFLIKENLMNLIS